MDASPAGAGLLTCAVLGMSSVHPHRLNIYATIPPLTLRFSVPEFLLRVKLHDVIRYASP